MNPFKICYVSAEIAPFVNTARMRGLSQTSKFLPAVLKEMGQDIRLMMPKYKSINERKHVLREVIRLREMGVKMGGDTKTANGKTAFLPNSKVHVYFLSIPEYFDRKGLYKDAKTNKSFEDNGERFAGFCKGILETLKILYWQPDIIHCCDWSTALLPYYLKTEYANDEFFQNIRTVLTVHNFAAQGDFPADIVEQIDISKETVAAGNPLELNGRLNMLKAGLAYADVIATTSEYKANAVLSNPKEAHGLSDVLEARGNDLHGILGGMNAHTWDPETDRYLATPFNEEMLDQRWENKVELCNEFNLKAKKSTPMIAMITELLTAITLGPVIEAFKEILKSDVQLFVMEAKQSKYSEALGELAAAHPDKMVFYERFDKRLSHLITASADVILMTSESITGRPYQLNAMRYGALPVVRNIDGLADSVKPYDPETGEGNGFVFEKAEKGEIIAAIQDALKLNQNPQKLRALQIANMQLDFSWERTAGKYMALYDMAMTR